MKNHEHIAREPGIFEIHIAGSKTTPEITSEIFERLRTLGMPKHKFFLTVYNVPSEANNPHMMGTPPTGHDLNTPGFMSTAYRKSYSEARDLTLAAMDVLKNYKIKGNFEVERAICEKNLDFEADIRDFPGFCKVEDAPKYESHLGYKGRFYNAPLWPGVISTTPAMNGMIYEVQNLFGVTPHQIVDLCETHLPTPGAKVSRVVTIYQPSRESTLAFNHSGREKRESFLTLDYLISEQVCLVGEPVE